MIIKIYSIWDDALGAFCPPFMLPNDQMALRSFLDATKDPSSNVAKHPHDFHLYRLGELEDTTGAFTCPEKPERLYSASQLVDANTGEYTHEKVSNDTSIQPSTTG